MPTLASQTAPTTPPIPVSSNENQKSLAPAILIFALTTLVFFGVLALIFRPKDTTKADRTDGRVNRIQCEQMTGRVVALPNGDNICKIEGASFSLSD